MAETVGLLNVVTAELVGLIGEALRTGGREGRHPFTGALGGVALWRITGPGPAPGGAGAGARRFAPERGVVRGGVVERGPGGGDRPAHRRRSRPAGGRAGAVVDGAAAGPGAAQPAPGRADRPSDDPSDDDHGDGSPAGPESESRRAVRFAYGDDGMWWCSVRLRSDEGAGAKALEVAATRSSGRGTPAAATAIRATPATCPGLTGCCAWYRRVSTPSTTPPRRVGRRANARR